MTLLSALRTPVHMDVPEARSLVASGEDQNRKSFHDNELAESSRCIVKPVVNSRLSSWRGGPMRVVQTTAAIIATLLSIPGVAVNAPGARSATRIEATTDGREAVWRVHVLNHMPTRHSSTHT
jgi:hypothetical protein